MNKITTKQNIRIEVEPHIWGKYDEKYAIQKAHHIADDIKRHVDDCQSITVLWDTVSKCGYCGYEWEEDKETGEPLCCTKSQDEWQLEKNTKNIQKDL